MTYMEVCDEETQFGGIQGQNCKMYRKTKNQEANGSKNRTPTTRRKNVKQNTKRHTKTADTKNNSEQG